MLWWHDCAKSATQVCWASNPKPDCPCFFVEPVTNALCPTSCRSIRSLLPFENNEIEAKIAAHDVRSEGQPTPESRLLAGDDRPGFCPGDWLPPIRSLLTTFY